MKKLILIFITILLGGVVPVSSNQDQAPTPTKWISDTQETKPLHDAVFPNNKINLKLLPKKVMALNAQLSGRICLIVNLNIYNGISTEINQYSTDLDTAGYSTITYLYESGGAEGLRSELSNMYFSVESLVGAVLIGDIPHIIYEMVEKFEKLPSSEYEDFPCDIFYMDLNGGWYDCSNSYPYSSGKYDTRDGNLDLEIWVSRMKTDNLPAIGNETALLTNYFNKNHQFRIGNISSTNIALVYNDDDWAYMGEDDADYVGQVYDNTVLITNWNGTTADDYKDMRNKKNQQEVLIRLQNALRKDKARSSILPISEFGLVEMTRQRVKESISQSVYNQCPYCKGRGIVKSVLSVCIDLQRSLKAYFAVSDKYNLKIEVNPLVMEGIRDNIDIFKDLESRFKATLTISSKEKLHVEDINVFCEKTNKKINLIS